MNSPHEISHGIQKRHLIIAKEINNDAVDEVVAKENEINTQVNKIEGEFEQKLLRNQNKKKSKGSKKIQ